MAVDTERQERIHSLRAELEVLESETIDELEDTLKEGEEHVTEVAQDEHESTSDAHDEVEEGHDNIVEEVEHTADEIAEEVGEPSLAPEIADHLFRRLEDGGYLPHRPEREAVQHAEGEIAEVPAEAIEAPAEVAHAETAEVEVPPEPDHWWYRKRGGRR